MVHEKADSNFKYMSEETNTTTNSTPTVEASAPVVPATPTAAPIAPQSRPVDRGGFKKNVRKPMRREARVKPEFDQKIISIRRVTRVVTGGRRFAFSVAIVAGNRKGSVGVGLGKANDTSIAIDKAVRDAKKNMITLKLNKHNSIPHEVDAKFSSSRVFIMPAPGRGVIAGTSVRTVLELAGVKDVGAKIRSGSKNRINNARAAIAALSMLREPRNK